MNPDQNIPAPARLQKIAFYILLVTVVLAPLVFWPSQYFALESVKTVVIGVLTMAAFIVLAVMVTKDKQVKLPPKSMLILGGLMTLSLVISAVSSGNFLKSFFGQGFEIGAASFIITLALATLVTFSVIVRNTSRIVIIYAGMVAAFLVLWVFQVVRLIAGPDFASLGILSSVTSTILGNWFSLGLFAVIIAIISLLATIFLPLTRKMKIAYYALFSLAFVTIFIVNSPAVWQSLMLVSLGLTIYLSSQKPKVDGSMVKSFVKRLSWFPLVIFVVSLVFAWNGNAIAGKVVDKMGTGYTEFSLPWRMTLDIAAGELKQAPLLGAGPNRFLQAYLVNKPVGINTTDAWGIEFSTGFGLIPTFLVTQGFLGGIVWVLFFVYLGILGVRSLRGLVRVDGSGMNIPEADRQYARFAIISSYAAAVFVWIAALIYVPVHTIMYLGFIMTGMWLAAAVYYSRLTAVDNSKRYVVFVAWICVILGAFWGLTYMKNAVALYYFGSGVKQLTSVGNPQLADTKFAKAVMFNPLDIYWQARAESNLAVARQMLSAITATSSAEASQAVASSSAVIVNQAMTYTNNAISADSDNYNNYVSQARVAEVASAMRMASAYQTAVDAYNKAISHNPLNPSIYLSLARLQASANQLDASIQTVGAALRVKPNYLDAVFLLSQVEAAKGNLGDAIIAAQFATQLNPTNPLTFFQLGLLQYTKGDYAPAKTSFEQAVKIEANYANAQYFLGLSLARLGDATGSLAIFEKLLAANPTNADINTIVNTLRSGRSLFAAPVTPAAAKAEKRSGPPIPVR